MGEQAGALAHTREALTPTGVVMLVGPCASDDVASNLNPLGRLPCSALMLICTPAYAVLGCRGALSSSPEGVREWQISL
jgi:hypothetical protein